MLAVLFVVVLILFALVVWLFYRFKQVHQRISSLEQSLGEDISVELSPHLKLVIHDPQGIAKRESKLAKAVAAVSPEYIKYRVYKQVANELELALSEREIKVSIELVGLKSGKPEKDARGAKGDTASFERDNA